MTTITSSQQVLEKITQANEALQLAKKNFNNACEENFESYLSSLFEEHAELDVIEFIAWTPGFNDGSPCTRSSEILITPYDFVDWGLDVPGDFDEEFNALPPEVTKKISSDLWNFDEWLEEEYGTDYRLTVVRTSDKILLPENWETMSEAEKEAFSTKKLDSNIVIEQSSYDCGY